MIPPIVLARIIASPRVAVIIVRELCVTINPHMKNIKNKIPPHKSPESHPLFLENFPDINPPTKLPKVDIRIINISMNSYGMFPPFEIKSAVKNKSKEEIMIDDMLPNNRGLA